ncbi:MAG: hypothetical protein DI529_17905 [Chryseobacterium sp.]|nr:MAG: hypothetical protein DI529_17905 [Chryseobacterium sp.]
MNFDDFMKENPLIWGIFVICFGIILIFYSRNNITYSKKRMKELEDEVKTDNSKYFNYGINKSIYTRAIITIIIAVGMIIYGISVFFL